MDRGSSLAKVGATVAEDEGVLGSWFLWLDNCPELFHISDLQFCQP